MTPTEAAAAARLGGRAGAGLTSHVKRIHMGIGGRLFGAVGPAAAPVRLTHDAVATVVYRSVGRAIRGGGGIIGAALGAVMPEAAPPVGASATGSQMVAALNAVVGEGLAHRSDPLAISMAVRVAGRDVTADATSLATVFPHASKAVVVFLHGLGEHESSWRLRADVAGGTYGDRLAADLGVSPVFVRYNTGLHISENGRQLSCLLAALVQAWPEPVERLVLVGHSMGGLVARAACHLGTLGGDQWTQLVSDVVYLGSPHGGARLARTARLVASALSRLPENACTSAPLDHSPGIRDLRHGYVTAEDWETCDDGSCLEDHGTHVPLLASANHYAVSATIVPDARSAAGRVVGDFLVQPASAQGRRTSGTTLQFLDRLELAGRHHFSLLNDDEVYAALRQWIVAGAGQPAEV